MNAPIDLPFILAPVTVEEFFDNFWEKRVMHVPRSESRYFASLRDDLSLEEILWQTCHRWGDVSIAGMSGDSTDFSALPPTLPTIREAFSAGRTIVINHLERKLLGAAWLCRNVERKWLFDTHVNLYATPPQKQGLAYHYDDDDVFIIQLDGCKKWKVFHDRAGVPLPGEAYQQPDCDSAAFTEYLLRPGHLLYIPRGFVHEAAALQLTSVHLTLTVTVVRLLTLLQEVLSAAVDARSDLRRAVPMDLLVGRDAEPDRQLLARAGGGSLTGTDAWRRATTEMIDRLLASKQRLPSSNGGGIQAADPGSIDPESVVSIAADQICLLTEGDGSWLLHFIGGTLELPLVTEQALRRLCRLTCCVVRDLPGPLTVTEKVGMVRALMAVGVLVAEPSARYSTEMLIDSNQALRRDGRAEACR